MITLRPLVMFAVVGVVGVVVGALCAGCAIEAEELPGRPCENSADCGAFACVRVDGRQDSVCAPRPPAEVEVGCDGVDEGGACGDGDGCTVDDTCSDGVCAGVALDCGDDEVCNDGVCEVVGGTCVEVAPRVASANVAAPRIAYNADDDEVGVVFEGPVRERTESFFIRLGQDGAALGTPVQLTDGTPATADDSPVNSFARDIAYAPEEQRYGILVDRDAFIGGGISFAAVTADGIPAGNPRSIVTSLASAGIIRFPARLDWNGSRFFAAVIEPGSEFDSVVVDSVDATGGGSSIGNDTIAEGAFGGVDIAANLRVGELGFAYNVSDNVVFARANDNGDLLVERPLATGRPVGRSPGIALADDGYIVVWQEGTSDDGDSVIVGAALDDDGAITTPARVLTDVGELAQLPAITGLAGGGAVIVYFATEAAGAFAIHTRRLAADLTPAAPQTIRAGLAGGFAPTIDGGGAGANGALVVGYGVTVAAAALGDVETTRVCE